MESELKLIGNVVFGHLSAPADVVDEICSFLDEKKILCFAKKEGRMEDVLFIGRYEDVVDACIDVVDKYPGASCGVIRKKIAKDYEVYGW